MTVSPSMFVVSSLPLLLSGDVFDVGLSVPKEFISVVVASPTLLFSWTGCFLNQASTPVSYGSHYDASTVEMVI